MLRTVFMASLVLAGAISQPTPTADGQSPRGSQNQAQTPRGEAVPAAAPNAAPQTICSPVVVANSPQSGQNDGSKASAADWSMVWLTGLLALATFILGAVAWKQLESQKVQTEEALRLSREANESARQANESAARHSEQLLALTRSGQRAWVSLDTLGIEPGPGSGCVIVVGLKNSGHSPARIEEANITLRGYEDKDLTRPYTLETLPDEPKYDLGRFAPPAILVAGEVSRMRHHVTLATRDGYGALKIPGDKVVLWVYGKVIYRDGVSEESRTYRWAREYDPFLSAAGETPKFRFRHVSKPEYNSAD
jgi:hypothetical protein